MTAALPAIADGIVRQKNYKKEVPPPVKYALTTFGHAQQGLERRLELRWHLRATSAPTGLGLKPAQRVA
jgi:hypothetical protein